MSDSNKEYKYEVAISFLAQDEVSSSSTKSDTDEINKYIFIF